MEQSNQQQPVVPSSVNPLDRPITPRMVQKWYATNVMMGIIGAIIVIVLILGFYMYTQHAAGQPINPFAWALK